MSERVAVYAGSFDPVTNGHMWVIQQGARLFDRLIVAVGVNPEKSSRYMFTVEERITMLRETIRAHAQLWKELDRVEVKSMNLEFLYNFAFANQSEYLLRGVRNITDFEYEKSFRSFNDQMGKHRLRSVLLISPDHLASISSSFVKGMIGYDNWKEVIREFLPSDFVYQCIIDKAGNK